MSDGEVEIEAPQAYPVLPKDVTAEIGSTKLFNKWSYEDVEIRDISLTYVQWLKNGSLEWTLKRQWHTTYEPILTRNRDTVTTSKSASQSTSRTPPVDTP
jgi:hypothetical protein